MQIHPLQQEFDLLYKEMNDLYHAFAAAKGLSDSAQMVLYTICELGEGCLQKDICDRCFLSKQTVHSAVRKLAEEGILTMTPGKGRDMHLSLTEVGQALAERTVYPLAEAEFRALEALTPAEQAELIRLTRKYTTHLSREMGQRSQT